MRSRAEGSKRICKKYAVKEGLTSIDRDTYTYSMNGYQAVAKKIRNTFDITKLMN
jgi:hypothetical protein